ncbi:MAG TPA: Na-translocating system protein MpsC family protein [Solirubrobacterales bacterium]|nr:Na-translocating system protein MpsC family protein [Solirubrobacterales bacterium]
MDATDGLTGGELNAAITRAVTRIHTETFGRGPKKATSFHSGNVVVTLLEESMTKAERTLVDAGEGNAVLSMRLRLQRSMEDELKAHVGSLTARAVTALMSGNHLAPDMAIEVFVLDGEVGRPGARGSDQSLD